MRRNRRNQAKKERIIMLTSSALVLCALTMTGMYMQAKNEKSKDDGYRIDFSALDQQVGDKAEEIARATEQTGDTAPGTLMEGETIPGDHLTANQEYTVIEDDLDYMPMEAGSNLVEIPGLTNLHEGMVDELPVDVANQAEAAALTEGAENPAEEDSLTETEKPVATSQIKVERELHFAPEDGLLRPVQGEVLIPFSMDSSVYFSTLDQYKYNPALIVAAEEGTVINACVDGKVVDLFEDAEIGKAVTLDLGDGYKLTLGQLRDISVTLDSYVEEGDTIGVIAAPTKYYSREGSNLYLKLEKDGSPVDPETLFR